MRLLKFILSLFKSKKSRAQEAMDKITSVLDKAGVDGAVKHTSDIYQQKLEELLVSVLKKLLKRDVRPEDYERCRLSQRSVDSKTMVFYDERFIGAISVDVKDDVNGEPALELFFHPYNNGI